MYLSCPIRIRLESQRLWECYLSYTPIANSLIFKLPFRCWLKDFLDCTLRNKDLWEFSINMSRYELLYFFPFKGKNGRWRDKNMLLDLCPIFSFIFFTSDTSCKDNFLFFPVCCVVRNLLSGTFGTCPLFLGNKPQ